MQAYYWINRYLLYETHHFAIFQTSCPHNHSPLDALKLVHITTIPNKVTATYEDLTCDDDLTTLTNDTYTQCDDITRPTTGMSMQCDDITAAADKISTHITTQREDSRVYNSCFCEGKLLSDYNVLADEFYDVMSEVSFRCLSNTLDPL